MFGSYSLAYTDTSNNINRRSIPYIVLNETNNRRGNYLMILYTVNILHSYEWTEIPIENDITEKVNQLSSNEKGPLVKNKYPMFEWAPGIPT